MQENTIKETTIYDRQWQARKQENRQHNLELYPVNQRRQNNWLTIFKERQKRKIIK